MNFSFIVPALLSLNLLTLTAFAQTAGTPVKGGIAVFNLAGEPPTVHPITSTDAYSERVKLLVLDTLLGRNLDTYEWIPRLAEKWEVSKDGKTFTFTLRNGATFHDGKPVTADDVKFSFDAIFDPKYQAAHLIPYFQGIEKVEIVSPTVVKFIAKEKYFKNIDVIGEFLYIIPKHIYGDVDKSKRMNTTLVGSGPYIFERYDRGQKIVLKRFDTWAAGIDPLWKNAFNFEKIDFRFYKTDNIMIERAKKGDLDYIREEDFLSEAFHKKAIGPQWGKTVFKEKVSNLMPKGYLFIGWNQKNELFQDRDVRVALAHLMNREELNQKFRNGESDLATGPIYIGSEYKSPNLKPFLYDQTKARELLAKAGWKDSDKDGILDKMINGKKRDFRFTMIYPAKDAEKYWTMYKEDLKKSGIDLELRYLEWNAFSKALDDRSFEACSLAWAGGDVDMDLKQIWHSSSSAPGGSNFIGYKNSEVDKLIDKARLALDKKERIPLMQKIDEIVGNDAPYLFMFNNRYFYYAHSNKIERTKATYQYDVGSRYWWMTKK